MPNQLWDMLTNLKIWLTQGSWLAFMVFVSAFYFGPFTFLEHLKMMPGYLGDPRLNNYFLENIYLYLKGLSGSLWNLGFFYPFPYVGGFSDNLFGASPPYLASRFLGAQTETAYQIWFLAAYPANFFSAYFIFRRWGLATLSSTLGALIYSFSLPVTAFSEHAQLGYRFPIPFAIDALFRFSSTKNPRDGIAVFFWLVWQFYISIYLAFFLAFLLIGSIASKNLKINFSHRIKYFKDASANIYNRSVTEKTRLAIAAISLFFLLLFLLLPYIEVSLIYKAKRNFAETSAYLPRIESYFFTGISPPWRMIITRKFNIPAPWEHQLFIGFFPTAFLVLGIIKLFRNGGNHNLRYDLLWGCILITLITLYAGQLSPWRLIGSLPFASAIRAVSRIELVLLLPIAYFCAYALHGCQLNFIRSTLLVLLFTETAWVDPPVTGKSEWQYRLTVKEKLLPSHMPPDAILFFSQPDDRESTYIDEVDAMWLGMEKGLKTLNGYSGLAPPGVSEDYGTNCSEAVKRVLAYQQLTGNSSEEEYQKIMRRIVPIGFDTCDSEWLKIKPTRNGRNTLYPQDFFKSVHLESTSTRITPRGTIARIKITNENKYQSLDVGGEFPVFISWRWIDASGNPLSGWDSRVSLPFDIQAHKSLTQDILVGSPSKPIKSQYLEFSLVHEHFAWGHDMGMKTLRLAFMD